MSASTMPPPFKQCPCGATYQTRAHFEALPPPPLGGTSDFLGVTVVWRNCRCDSTLAVESDEGSS